MSKPHSDELKSEVLAYYSATGGNLTKTARDYKLPKQTVHRWVQGDAINPDVSRLADDKKGTLADTCESLVWQILGSIDEETILDSNLTQRTTAAGTLVDKMQLLRNKPTEIVEDASLSDAERAERIAAILDRARARRDGQTASDAESAP